ncbi:hypothetical protein CDL12_16363 [Handroanthus impetiginosus]|uniref:Uncharacterized protein n=1 Tax=Handroanthus impetiginosus TaxID=429701 RepID=A0A2G9H180_9LAMI|nr:hypothetical protein CDL12_16363 [Handroanthus impetiginosus]
MLLLHYLNKLTGIIHTNMTQVYVVMSDIYMHTHAMSYWILQTKRKRNILTENCAFQQKPIVLSPDKGELLSEE